MRRHLRSLAVLALAAAALSGCGRTRAITDPLDGPVFSGGADFSRVVALGTSISAGTQSDGLVVHHQQKSFTYLFARQVGAPYSIPSVSAFGIPALLRIQGVTPLGGVVISRAGLPEGVETNRGQTAAYENMAVPFAVLPDCADTSLYYVSRFPGDARPRMFDIVARHRGSVLSQALSLRPTFVTFEFGSNEILGAAGSGSGTPLVPPAQWAGLLNLTLNALQAGAPGAGLALVNVPDPTTTPLVTTFKPVTRTAGGTLAPLIGPGGAPLTLGDFVLLTAGDSLAAGTGFPVGVPSYLSGVPGNGRPLPDRLVLSATEVASLRDAVVQYNAAVAAEAAARGATLVDLHGLLRTAVAEGIRFQGATLTPAFVTGGLFSLDGAHPTDIAHGFLGNLLIDAVNARFGARVPHIDLNAVASATSSRAAPAAGGEGAAPWLLDAEAVFRPLAWRTD
jgi:hypothetical protein